MLTRHPPEREDGAVSVLCVGDVHFTTPPGGQAQRARIVARDLETMVGRDVLDAVVQLGDQTTYADARSFAAYLSWRASLPLPAGVQYGQVPGNHDLIGTGASGTPDLVTTAEWAAIMGQDGPHTVIDLPGVRLLLIAPAADATTGQASVRRLTVDADVLAWCDARLVERPDARAVVFFHAPLPDTVGPLDGSPHSSYDPLWRVHWDDAAPLPQWLTEHPRVVAWVSGHTHARLDEDGIVTTYGQAGTVAINVGSPAFWTPGPIGAVTSVLLTIRADRIEVRHRDHGAGQWLAPARTMPLGVHS